MAGRMSTEHKILSPAAWVSLAESHLLQLLPWQLRGTNEGKYRVTISQKAFKYNSTALKYFSLATGTKRVEHSILVIAN